MDGEFHTGGNRLFYLAVAPEYFSDIIKFLGDHGMAQPVEGGRRQRQAVGAHHHREAVRA